MLVNIIVGLVILAIVALAIRKIVSEKKKGAKCVGCPYSTASSPCACPSEISQHKAS